MIDITLSHLNIVSYYLLYFNLEKSRFFTKGSIKYWYRLVRHQLVSVLHSHHQSHFARSIFRTNRLCIVGSLYLFFNCFTAICPKSSSSSVDINANIKSELHVDQTTQMYLQDRYHWTQNQT